MNRNKPTQTWIGVQDFADTAVKWLDAGVSFSWLRAFEEISAISKTIAYIREQHYTYNMTTPIRGVLYRFRKLPFPTWIPEIIAHAPHGIIYNLCEYNIAAQALVDLRRRLPNAKHILRLHHEARYLLAHKGFRECLFSADLAIVPTMEQLETLRRAGFEGPAEVVPFGVDKELMGTYSCPFNQRPYDFACANTSAPQKNMELMQAVFEVLTQRGYNAQNFGGLSSAQLAQKLGQSKIFFQPSMTEASGSRVLLEGIAAGCYPVAVAESPTTSNIAVEHGGQALETGISYDFNSRKMTNPEGVHVRIADQLVQILSEISSGSHSSQKVQLSSEYDEKVERKRLCGILLSDTLRGPRIDLMFVQAAKTLLAIVGTGDEKSTDLTTIQRASATARDPAHLRLAERVAEAICRDLAYPQAAWGLTSKLFRPSFSFREEVQWIIANTQT